MKIYNLVLALLLVVIMATAVTAAVSISPISTQKIATDKESTTVSFTATASMSYSADCADPAIATAGTPSSSSVVISRGTVIGSTTCTVTVFDPLNPADTASSSFTLSVEPRSMLSIDRLDVIINGDSDRLDDGDDFDVKIGDTLEFQVKVENKYSGDDDEDFDIENVEVTVDIEDWDDGDNEEFESDDDVDVKADDTETLTVSIDDIPTTIDDGSHTITITVEGRDEETGFRHKETWTVEMNIEKEDEDIQISSASLEPSSVTCDRNAVLSVKLMNAGTDDSDEIVLSIKNSQLGISLQDYDIELDEGDSDTLEYSLKISDSVEPGVYAIKLLTFFDTDGFEDDDFIDSENVQLTVGKCQETTPIPPVEEEEEEEEEVVVVEPEKPVTPPAEEEEVKPASTWGISDKTLVIALVVLNVLLLIAIIIVIISVTSG